MNRMLGLAALIALFTVGALWLLDSRTDAASKSITSPKFDEAFGMQWRDGKAELAGYELTYPRYGQLRSGTAVAVFVTEPFSKADRLKPELGGRPADDTFGVIKQNLMEDFSTGIYDYNLMTSAFVSTEPALGRPAGTAAKVSFNAQEWCGHVYHHVLFDADTVRETWHSYFDGEGDGTNKLTHPAQALPEDALLLWARGLAAPALESGESMNLQVLRSLAVCRLLHVPVAWDSAKITRQAGRKQITVPAGSFEVETFTVEIASATTTRLYGGTKVTLPARTWTIHVEKAAPHRIVHFSRSDGYEGKLTGSARLAYWQLNGNGKEALLTDLGLRPRAERMP